MLRILYGKDIYYYQISTGSSTFPSPLTWSSTGQWSVSRRDTVNSGSKHLRAGVKLSSALFLYCRDLGGFNNEGLRLKRAGSVSDCMKDKCPQQLPNCIMFWRIKNWALSHFWHQKTKKRKKRKKENWAFRVLRPWDFMVNLVPQHTLSNPNTLGSHLTSLVSIQNSPEQR